jgi:hypothetical protein
VSGVAQALAEAMTPGLWTLLASIVVSAALAGMAGSGVA